MYNAIFSTFKTQLFTIYIYEYLLLHNIDIYFLIETNQYKHKDMQERGTWVPRLVKCQTSPKVMISRFMGSRPPSGSVLTAQSLEPVSHSVSPSLSASSPLTLCPCPSLKNKYLKIKKKDTQERHKHVGWGWMRSTLRGFNLYYINSFF